MRTLTAALIAICLPGTLWAEGPRIVDKPIRFDAERVALSLRYIKRHYGLQPTDLTIVPKAIVVHWTGTRSYKAAWKAFDRARIRRGRRRVRRAGAVNLSAHFLVDRDGTIYRLMPETQMARHCIGLNYDSIGIENVGGGPWPLTNKQLAANAELVRYLVGRYPIRYLLGHMEWPRFEDAPFFRELDPSYRHHKPDPGRRFMRRLRANLRGLHLEGAYAAAGSTRRRELRKPRPLTKPVIESQVDGAPWNKARAIYPLKGQRVVLRVRPREAASIRWFQIVPDIRTIYKNANHPWEHNAYKWIGYAKIRYIERELKQAAGKWTLEPLALLSRPPFESSFYRRGVGSYWLQARVARGDRVLASPGVSQTTTKGLSPLVFRISVREGPGYLGYVTSFFNVPGLFGSTPYQSSNYIGADCADVLMAAYGQFQGRPIRKNFNVAMLVHRFANAARFHVSGGTPQRPIRWNHDVLPGDLIAVRYNGARKFQHIGVLAEDHNRNGRLDGPDLVLHAGPHPLTYSRLDEGAFDGLVAALRPPTTTAKDP